MKRAILCAVLVMVSVSSAFGNATDELLKAVQYENTTPKEIQTLINSGADVNAKGIFDMTALMCAATVNSKPDVIKTLVKAGADVNAKNNSGWTALMYAATNNSNPKVITALLNAGVDIFAKNNSGKTVLDYAHTDEIKRLILDYAQ